MKQEGFGSTEVIAFLFVILLSCTIVAILVNRLESRMKMPSINETSSTEDKIPSFSASNYDALEENIADLSKNYFSNNTTSLDVDYVNLEVLIQDGYINRVYELKHGEEECHGYVAFYKSMDTYKTYLNCGDIYQTKGYDALREID